MRDKGFWLKILVMILVFGMVVPGCIKAQTDTRLNGTWLGDNGYISKYNSGFWEDSDKYGIPECQGTFTTIDGKMFIIFTHIFGTSLELDSRWYSMDELEADGINISYNKNSIEYTINGNTLILRRDDRTWNKTLVNRDGNFVKATSGGQKFGSSDENIGKSTSIDNSNNKFQGTWTGYYRDEYIELYISGSTWRILSVYGDHSGKCILSGDRLTLITEGTFWSNNNFTATVAGNGMIIDRSGSRASLTRK